MRKQSREKPDSKKKLTGKSRVPPAAKAIPAVPEAPRRVPVGKKKGELSGSRKKTK